MSEDALDLEGVEDAYPLTAAQSGMLFHTLSEPGTGVYIGCFSADLPSAIDLPVFKAAWEAVARRHQTLRSVFVWEGMDAPVQVVLETPDLRWEESRWPEDADEQQALLEEAQQGGVDLATAPATRFVLFRGEGERLHFAWLCHHALIDDWSAAQVMDEVARAYKAIAAGEKQDNQTTMPFRDFVDWLENEDADAAKTYWLQAFGDYNAPATIQLDAPTASAEVLSKSQSSFQIEMDAQTTDRLTAAAKQLRVTPNAILSVLWGIVLHRLSGQDDVAFGLAVTLRPPELEGIETAVGNFVTTVPARMTVEAEESLRDLFTKSHDALIAARQHATLSLHDIRGLTALQGNAPLFETILSVETATPKSRENRDLFSNLNARDRSHFPLSVIVSVQDSLSVTILHDVNRFSAETARFIAGMFKQALMSFDQQLDDAPTDLRVLDQDAENAATAGLAGDVLPRHGLVLDDIQQHARRTPEQVAIVAGAHSITYRTLDELTESWARVLHSSGVTPGSRVALYMERDAFAIVGMLAVLRAACSYVPVNATQRTQRALDILQDCGAAAILTTKALKAQLPSSDLPLFLLDDPPPKGNATDLPVPAASDAAYVIYTSGSTGKPKGVVVSQANLAASTAARRLFYPEKTEAFLLLSSIEFDSSVAGIYGTLTAGGTLVLPALGEEQDVSALAQYIKTHGVTDLLCLPSLLELLFVYAPDGHLASLKTAISAGEELMESCHAAWQSHAPHVRLYNEYGPTEATVWCVACEIGADDAVRRMPIGRPIPGSHHYIRDAHQRPVPQGLPGELWVGGPGVALGYLNNAELTTAKFVPDPKTKDTKLYRTGDMVRLRSDGMLDYLGRADHQIKIRGHRVELGEIEAVLMARPEISSAAVVHFASGRDVQLGAFVVLEHGANLAVDALRASLRDALPEWMVPHRFAVLADMPRTASGKIDRNALELPEGEASSEIVAPRNQLERELAAIWKEILWLDRDIGVHEDFAELGGHSLLSIRLVNEIEAQLGKKLPLAQIGRLTTIGEQAQQIEKLSDAGAASPEPLSSITGGSRLFEGLTDDQLSQMHAYMAGWPGTPLWEGSMYRGLNTEGSLPPLFWCFNWGKEFAAMAKALGPDQPLYGTRSGHLVLDVEPETQQWDNRRVAMQTIEEVLKIQPEGPYYIGGNCQGAAIAMETAQVLNGLALPVGLVLMMEAVTEHAFHGPVALIFGDASDMNPYALSTDPETDWSRRYLSYTVDTIRGGHGQFFNDHNIRQLAHAVARRLADARKSQDMAADFSAATQPAAQSAGTAIDTAVEALRSQTQSLADSGAISEAVQIAQTALDLRPDDFEALKLLGMLLAAQDDIPRAEPLLLRALDQRDDPQLRVRLAQIQKAEKEKNPLRYKLRSKLKRITGHS